MNPARIGRARRVGLLPTLLAFGLLLAGSPVGQMGLLRLHLAEAHHDAAPGVGPERSHDHGSPRRHSVAPNVPHEHNGRVHVHEPEPVDDPAPLADALSRFFLAAQVAQAVPPVRNQTDTPWLAPVLRGVIPPVETPPPRLPG